MSREKNHTETTGAAVVLAARSAAGLPLVTPAGAHGKHSVHGADVEHTYEYRFFYLLLFAVFLFVGCVRYVLALSSMFTSSADHRKPIPRPFMEGRSTAQIYVPYIFQL